MINRNEVGERGHCYACKGAADDVNGGSRRSPAHQRNGDKRRCARASAQKKPDYRGASSRESLNGGWGSRLDREKRWQPRQATNHQGKQCNHADAAPESEVALRTKGKIMRAVIHEAVIVSVAWDILSCAMDIQIRDRSRQPIGVAQVDPAARPMLVRAIAADGAPHEIYLDWEHALDDAGQLRSCVTCGCQHLYRRRTLPRFAPFALVLAGAGVVAGVLGYSSDPIVLAALVALLVLDGAVLVLARVQLVCYRCGSAYGGAPIARYHRAWDARVAAEPDNQPVVPNELNAPNNARGPSLPSNP